MRLGRKYKIHHLRDEAINRLRSEFPSSLEEWLLAGESFTHLIPDRSIHFDIINLARENDLPYLLPAAFISCHITLTYQQMLQGVCRDDGTLVTLSTEDQRLMMLGWHALIEMQFKETFKWMDEAKNCNAIV